MKPNKDIQLVKTDYDDFKDLTFFIKQQQKAEAMLREVEDFKKSFILSKLISINDWIVENPLYNLELFKGVEFCYYMPKGKKPRAYIKVVLGDFEHFVIAKQYGRIPKYDSITEDVKKFNSKKRKILKDFWWQTRKTSVYYDVYKNNTYVCVNPVMRMPDGQDEDSNRVAVPEETTLFIVENWEDYVDINVLQEEYSKYYFSRVSTGYDKMTRTNIKHIYVDAGNHLEGINYDKIYAEIRRRFSEPIELIERLYHKHYVLSAMKYGDAEGGEGFFCHPSVKNCVMWEGRPRWVSNQLSDVRLTTSKDYSQVICEFQDNAEYSKWRWPSNSPVTRIKRTCTLTYSTKNNELIDYKTTRTKGKYKYEF